MGCRTIGTILKSIVGIDTKKYHDTLHHGTLRNER